MSDKLNRLVWIDCEMTGLDPQIDQLVEIATVVTDAELNVLDPGLDLIIRADQSALDHMNEFVTRMHTTSGLIEEIPEGLPLAEAQQQTLDYVKQFVPEPGTAPLCGNTIGTDRMFIARYMPELDTYLHYRNIDVSTLKELAHRWYPRAYFNAPEKKGGHRALADILESIQELRYYRQAILVEQPGPSSEQAQAISAALTQASSASQPQ
ncbi:MAG TPA: oligoribonuclease [Pseudoclavibacter sp.]|nr:oligoribonuclease [Pseudoclavibacter sp.]